MTPAKRCPESRRLSDLLTEQCLSARELGIGEDSYPPFKTALANLREHFQTCRECREWVDEWERQSKNQGRGEDVHAPVVQRGSEAAQKMDRADEKSRGAG